MEPKEAAEVQQREARRFGAAWGTALAASAALATVILVVVWLA